MHKIIEYRKWESGKVGKWALWLLSLSLLLAFPLSTAAQTIKIAGANQAIYSGTNGVGTNMWHGVTNSARVYDITVFNTGASDLYVLVFDSKTNMLDGNIPSIPPVKVLAGTANSYFWTGGRNFRRGVTVATSTTPATLTNSSPVFLIDISYYDAAY